LWMARSWRCGFPGGWPWKRRWAKIDGRGLDARNGKNHDLTPGTRLAEALRRGTTLTVGCIAQELRAGVCVCVCVPQTMWKARTKRKKNGAETRD
jgi:hypothetical protein